MRISTSDGSEVITTTSKGPWLLVDLPAGAYDIAADYRGTPKTLKVQVPASGLKEVTLRW